MALIGDYKNLSTASRRALPWLVPSSDRCTVIPHGRERPRIRLLPDELEFGEFVGEERDTYARANHFVHRNNYDIADDPEMVRRSDKHGGCCELAGALWLGPCYWWPLVDKGRLHGPDIEMPNGIKIDVKGMWQDHHRLLVMKNYHPGWIYLSISAEHKPDYLISDWMWGYELEKAWYRKPRSSREAPCFVVEHHDAAHHTWQELDEVCGIERVKNSPPQIDLAAGN